MKPFRYVHAVVALALIIFHQTLEVGAVQSPDPEFQHGDILVGAAASPVPAWIDHAGAIYRVRGSQVEKLCEAAGSGPDYWNVPYEVMVDAQGRVVFLASLGPQFFSGQNIGLLRCNGMGQPAERLAVFQNGASVPDGWPNPFPGQSVWAVKGLHLSRTRAIKIIDDENRGRPQLTTVEKYVLGFAPGNAGGSGNPDSRYQIWQYDLETGEWSEGPPIVDTNTNFRLDMIYEAGNTYSVSENKLGRYSNGLNINLEATIGEFVFGAQLNLFGGFNQVPVPIAVDDLSAVNPPSGNNCSGSMPAEYGGFRPLYGLYNVVFDTFGSLGLMMTSDSGANHAVSSNWQETLINPDRSDDRSAYFEHPYFGCALAPYIGYQPLLTSLLATHSGAFAAAPGGPVGISYGNGYLVRLRPGLNPEVIADSTAIPWAGGVAVYPANVSTGKGITLILRFDSPIDPLLTFVDGRRLGIDAVTGEVINDFGDNGFVGEPGEPRFFALQDPPEGGYRIDAIGTGHGPYTIHVYSIDLEKPEGEHIKTSGSASIGATATHTFTRAEDGTIRGDGFGDGSDSGTSSDATPPTIVAILSTPANAAGWHNADVTVSWAVTDAESGIAQSTGCDPVTVTGDTAGVTLTCTATNGAGLHASESVVIRLDKTPPVIAASRTPEANAYGWNNTDVVVAFSCTDALSGLDATSIPGATTIAGEGANQSATGSCADRAGNQASATVGGINIDKTAPQLACGASPSRLSPPNHKLVPVAVAIHIDDSLSGSAAFILSAASSTEADAGLTPDDLGNDIQEFLIGTPDNAGKLRAERSGRSAGPNDKPGRLYTLRYEGRDRAGNTGTCAAAVAVPHDQRK